MERGVEANLGSRLEGDLGTGVERDLEARHNSGVVP